MSDEWIIVPNWEKFQHYKDRNPKWIKVYTELASDADWLALPDAAKGMLVLVWCEYARSNGQLSGTLVTGSRHHRRRKQVRDLLVREGFIELSASKPLALPYQIASPEKRRREPSKEGSLSDTLARASSQAKPRASASKPGDYDRGLNMTRNGGYNYDDTAYQEELDRLQLTPDERTTLEQLRNQLNTPVTSDPELW